MTAARASDADRAPRGAGALTVVGALLLSAFAGFAALGAWQVQRLHWKHDLVARVDSRIHAQPVAAPARDAWPEVAAGRDEYRRVFVRGRFLADSDTRVEALTERGPGYWLLSPLRSDAGDIVLVNRGFVPKALADRAARAPQGSVRIEGLLRIDEPGGRVLRRNEPAQQRWYSRDVGAIAASRGLGTAAPFFIDAGFDAAAPEWPRGGMTVVRFRDHHLQYALTWFALALMVAVAAWRVLSEERRLRRRQVPEQAQIDVAHPVPAAGPGSHRR